MDRDRQTEPGSGADSVESDVAPRDGGVQDEWDAPTPRVAGAPAPRRSAWVDPEDPNSGRPALPSWPGPTDSDPLDAPTRAIDLGSAPKRASDHQSEDDASTAAEDAEDAPDAEAAEDAAPHTSEHAADGHSGWLSDPDRERTGPLAGSSHEASTRDRPMPPLDDDGPPSSEPPNHGVAGPSWSDRHSVEFGQPSGAQDPVWALPRRPPTSAISTPPAAGHTPDPYGTATRENRDGAVVTAPRLWLIALVGGVAGALVATLALLGMGTLDDDPEPAAAPNATIALQPAARPTALDFDQSGDGIAAVAAQTIPSIVSIQIFAVPGEPTSLVGAGSGVVYSADGLVMTNSHVIEGATEVRVSLSDGRTYVADVVGDDPVTDIAVVRIPTTDLTPIRLADMDRVEIGDVAIAIGNPLGLEGGPSVTSGVVSAFRRELEVDPLTSQRLYGLLQTDAPITRGSSGGALVDSSGALLGITTAIGVSDVGAEGLGFAVPAGMAESIALDLIEDGEIRHAFLGIEGQPAFASRDGAEVPVGAEILGITSNSAIGEAGARPGDVIVSLHGSPVTSMNTLVAELRMFRAGDVINVGLLRNGERVDLSLTLNEREG